MLYVLVILVGVVTLCETYYLSQQLKEFQAMVQESIAHLREQIEHSRTVKERAVEVLNYMRARLDELAQHPDAAQIRALAEELRMNTNKLAEAVSEPAEEE